MRFELALLVLLHAPAAAAADQDEIRAKKHVLFGLGLSPLSAFAVQVGAHVREDVLLMFQSTTRSGMSEYSDIDSVRSLFVRYHFFSVFYMSAGAAQAEHVSYAYRKCTGNTQGYFAALGNTWYGESKNLYLSVEWASHYKAKRVIEASCEYSTSGGEASSPKSQFVDREAPVYGLVSVGLAV